MNEYDDEWERIAPIFSDYQWHSESEMQALMGIAGLSLFDKHQRMVRVFGNRLNIETWGFKVGEERYRLTPPGELHVHWRWNSGETQEREARRAARQRT
jgi:hypothetical protein